MLSVFSKVIKQESDQDSNPKLSNCLATPLFFLTDFLYNTESNTFENVLAKNDHGPFCGNWSLPHSLRWFVLLIGLRKAVNMHPQMPFLLLFWARTAWKRSLCEIWEAGVKQEPLHSDGLLMVGYGQEICGGAWGWGKARSSLTLFSSIPWAGLPPDFMLTSRGCGHDYACLGLPAVEVTRGS